MSPFSPALCPALCKGNRLKCNILKGNSKQPSGEGSFGQGGTGQGSWDLFLYSAKELRKGRSQQQEASGTSLPPDAPTIPTTPADLELE